MIILERIDGTMLNLSVSPKFVEHYHKPGSFAKYILEQEINPGLWYDELLTALPNEAVVVDIGMNVELFSLYINCTKSKGGSFYIYGVEPTHEHVDVAVDLFEVSSMRNPIIFQGVIYNRNGMVKLFEEPQNTTSNRVGQDGTKIVNAMTLGHYLNYVKLDKVDLLKIDAEGSEKQIILEDPTIGEALQKCRLIFIETHTCEPGGVYMTLEERDALVEKVKSFGFDCKPGKRENSYYFIRQ